MISTSEDNVNLAVEFLRRKKYDETADLLLALKARAEVAEKDAARLRKAIEDWLNCTPMELAEDRPARAHFRAALEAKP